MSQDFGRSWNDEGLVIRTYDFREMDRIVMLFTRKRGKISALARGARKSGNRFGTALEPGTFCRLQLYRGRNLSQITQVELIRSCRKFLLDSPCWTVVNYCLVLIADCYESESPDVFLYEEVDTLFSLMEGGDNWQALLMKFRVDLLGFLGIRPRFDRCAVCGKTGDLETFTWSVHSGGLVCAECPKENPLARPFLPDLRRILELVESLSIQESRKIRFSQRQFLDLDRLLTGYYCHHLERCVPDWSSFSQRFPL